ncbi:helix-turn-helix domain-containing protein [Nocardia callitridis]|uniref:Helix-turn-helix domain-containing protein n=1 Tax=Nocardia callitridis TaxID=648753 RepID=A0ABP9KYZ3_9NOCA
MDEALNALAMHNTRTALTITAGEIDQARMFKAHIDTLRKNAPDDSITVGIEGTGSVTLPAELSSILSMILDLLGDGRTVTVGSMPNEVTTTVAAKMLGISRPTLMKLIDAGSLPAHKVGTHTRLLSKDVFAHKDSQRETQRAAFAQLRELEDELGVID